MMWTIALHANFYRNKYLQFGTTELASIAFFLQYPPQMQTGTFKIFSFFSDCFYVLL